MIRENGAMVLDATLLDGQELRKTTVGCASAAAEGPDEDINVSGHLVVFGAPAH